MDPWPPTVPPPEPLSPGGVPRPDGPGGLSATLGGSRGGDSSEDEGGAAPHGRYIRYSRSVVTPSRCPTAPPHAAARPHIQQLDGVDDGGDKVAGGGRRPPGEDLPADIVEFVLHNMAGANGANGDSGWGAGGGGRRQLMGAGGARGGGGRGGDSHGGGHYGGGAYGGVTNRDVNHEGGTHGDGTHGSVTWTHGGVTHGGVTHGDVTHGDVTPGGVTWPHGDVTGSHGDATWASVTHRGVTHNHLISVTHRDVTHHGGVPSTSPEGPPKRHSDLPGPGGKRARLDATGSGDSAATG